MYEERKESFSVRSLILQILFVVLTVFLLLWLFPTKNYVKDYANDAFTEKLQPLYNQIYNQNITTMKEAAINYFTNDRLPSKVGESVTITLKEMQDKKLVLDLIDSNNKKCDVEKSSVKVEKLDNEYLMTVKLECSDASNYIEVHLGCYDYCKASGVCEKKETPVIKPTNPTKPVISEKKYQYEYEKITDGKWGDFGEWSQWSKDTITKTEYRNVETKEVTKKTGTLVDVIDAKKYVKTTYSCPSGYTLNGTKCSKKTTDTKNATASTKTTYSCPSGYTLNGTKCSKKTTSSINATANKKTTYSCPSGYTLNGTKCNKVTTSSINATANKTTTYSCSSGYTLNGTKCSKKTTDTKNATANTTYGDWVSQGKQTFNTVQYSTDTRRVVLVASYIKTDCTSNCTTNKWVYLIMNRSKKTTYSCPSGYTLNGTKCKKTTTATKNATASTKTTYSCPSGYGLGGTKCYKGSMTTKNATSNTKTTYSCPSGYTLNGTKCKKTTTATKNATANKKTTYSCPSGYTLNGTKCSKKTTDTKTATKNEKVTYSCSNKDYTLNGDKCTKTVDVYTKYTYYRYQERKFISGTRDIKWSTSKTDSTLLKQGYVLTGNKKEIK